MVNNLGSAGSTRLCRNHSILLLTAQKQPQTSEAIFKIKDFIDVEFRIMFMPWNSILLLGLYDHLKILNNIKTYTVKGLPW